MRLGATTSVEVTPQLDDELAGALVRALVRAGLPLPGSPPAHDSAWHRAGLVEATANGDGLDDV